jgi:hypothetical protein
LLVWGWGFGLGGFMLTNFSFERADAAWKKGKTQKHKTNTA